jgi:hypothetical protein
VCSRGADAASVQAQDDQCAVAPCVSELTFTAGAGERDDMAIAYDPRARCSARRARSSRAARAARLRRG